MNDRGEELLADLSAIDARREKLREEIERLRSTPRTTECSVIPDSGVDVRYRNPDNSLDELNYIIPRSAGHVVGHTRYPEPGYTLYKDEQIVDRTLLKDIENKLPRFGTIRQPDFTETPLTPNPSLNTRCAVSSSASSTVTWSTNQNPVHKPVYSLPTRGMSNNDSNELPKEYSYGKTVMKSATYDGSGSWIDYKAHFEACSDINSWNMHQKSLYLAASLRGQAQTVLGNMRPGSNRTYLELCDALESRFAPANQTELYRAMLREKRQKPNECLPELGESIRRLAHLAYPTAPREVTEMIAKDQFVDALADFDMRLRIQQSRPKSLNDAIRFAVEIEAFCRAERQRRGDGGYVRNMSNNEVTPCARQDSIGREELRQLRDEIQASLKDLEKKIANVSIKETSATSSNLSKQGKFPFKCHHCGRKCHMIKNCFMKKNQNETKMRKSDLKNSTSLKENTDSQTKNGSIVSSTTSLKVDQDIQESGLFIKAIVNDTQCNLLVDTGATLTILSDQLYAETNQSGRIGLSPITQKIVGADGAPLTVQGKGLFYIKLGSQEFKTEAVIANIKADGIIGLDFLQTNQCLVDVCKTKMYVHGVEHELELQGNIGCFRVSLCETI